MANSQALTVNGERTRTIDPTAYAKLLKAIKSEIAAGRKLMAQAEAVTNWKVGKYISEFILQGKDRAGYGERVYDQLARDLDIDKRTLRHSVEFSRKFPIVSARSQLPWTHYRSLLSLPDLSARRRFVRKSLRENLTSRQLQKEVARYKLAHRPLSPDTNHLPPKLNAQRGTLYTYRLAGAATPLFKGSVFVDCGFRLWYPVSCALKSFTKDMIVETVVSGNSFEAVKSTRAQNDLYTYRACVTRVVDADTLWAEIDLGLGGVTLQKLRLRGVDAPEIDTAAGARAKRFVEKLLKPCPFIIVKTYKDQSDKYDRYLVDVYFKAGETDPAAVAATGEYLNQRLLDEGLAQAYKE